jgi:chitin disaccharide deacetylase
MKRIILCADDYGQNTAISQAIVDLLKQKRLSATSCMVTFPCWKETAPLLKPFENTADIGIHLSLTEGKPLSSGMPAFLPLKELLTQTFLRKLEKAPILAEFKAQLDHFIEVFGRLPDYIDGHHHIHQLPIVRDAIFELFDERFRDQPASYIRCTFDPASLLQFQSVAYLKQLFIQLTGAITFKTELTKRKILHNTSFSGIYNFATSYEYSDLFPRFLKQVRDGGIIMCHPGLMGKEDEDEIAGSRNHEYLYFCSAQFQNVCSSNEIALSRLKDIPRK